MKNHKITLANVLIKKAINLQPGDILHIFSPIEVSDFTDILVEQAYKNKAKFVYVEYYNTNNDTARLKYSNDEFLDFYPDFLVNQKIDMLNEKVSLLKLRPGIEYEEETTFSKKMTALNAFNTAMMKYTKLKRKGKYFSSCSTVVPTLYWAKTLFPDESSNLQALEKLWSLYFEITGVYETDPLQYWEILISQIENRKTLLNSLELKKLHIFDNKSNFTLELPHNHLWVGGVEKNIDNVTSMPNFPTEEIFTTLCKYSLNGIVHSSKPLVFQNKLVDDFHFSFKDGKIVDYVAKIGQDFLKEILNTDIGSMYCGEIALLSGETKISSTNTIFKTTLLDENAACHLALGCAYTCNVKDTIPYDYQNFEKNELNFSKIHIDFMFGSKEINVVGYYENNREISIISNGEWCI